ncbi:hypothetical protein [Bdellovibrio sp. BCCA]|uniref:hypothetical protein n=1 Tax=Bdellovibrio sp. BCCA TaxID=3136281 RepID=UPI0030F22258
MTTSAINPIQFVEINPCDINLSFLKAKFPQDQSVYTFVIDGKAYCFITLMLYSELNAIAEKRDKGAEPGVFTLKDNADWDRFLDKTVGEWERSGSPDPFASLNLTVVSFSDFAEMLEKSQASEICRISDGINQDKVFLPKTSLFELIKNAYA